MHEHNAFVTLTYNEDNYFPSLQYKHFQDFMRRLRKTSGKVRFFAVGEYGEENFRPHWHALLFGKTFTNDGPAASNVYRSKELEALWPFGLSSFGDVNYQTAGYVARYAIKKITGAAADNWYTRIDHTTGELVRCTPELARMSLKPGIGYTWFQKYWRDIYLARDGVVQPGGHTVPPPRYYDQLLEKENPDLKDEKDLNRYLRSADYMQDCTPARLRIRENHAAAKAAFMKRNRA